MSSSSPDLTSLLQTHLRAVEGERGLPHPEDCVHDGIG